MTTALQQRPWWDHMWGADAWGWMMFMMLFWVVVLVLAVWLVIRIARSQGWDGARGPGGKRRPEEIVRERYARGEIDRETYTRMLEDLRRGGEG